MSRDDEQFLKLGKMVTRMIRDVMERTKARGDEGYARREITFPGGTVSVFIATKDAGDVFERAADAAFAVKAVTPPSEIN
ncbi:MAG TPA: hypothetical protein VN736_28785 [Candidatus Limnocylindrales bacterium]|nr:hypothetical protein [Candidatus Limnocylindrales bacterium]